MSVAQPNLTPFPPANINIIYRKNMIPESGILLFRFRRLFEKVYNNRRKWPLYTVDAE
jgi:hypothetical protein